MTTIPNELIITINTSIPGYQKIKYKSSMTNPDINENDSKILFNPLVKLNKERIDTIPENFRKKQFFNKGLFESLITYNKATASKSLAKATYNGYIDNNIKIVLNTLFPENTVIYIGKEPYTIADIQWTKGDWKIDTVQVEQKYPYYFKPLQHFPTTIIYGNNYSGPVNITNTNAAGVAPVVPAPSPVPVVPASVPVHSPVPSPPPVKPSAPVKPSPTQVTPSTTQVTPSPPVKPAYPVKPAPPVPPKAPVVKPPPVPPKAPVIEPLDKYQISNNSTKNLREYFLNENFFYLMNTIYQFSSTKVKTIINQTLKYLTTKEISVDSLHVNKTAYKETIQSINVMQNAGGGDCFFIAVADAINNYNFQNQDYRIISGIYGTGGNLFTQKYLRELVANFFMKTPDIDEIIQNTSVANADNLNDIFERDVKAIEAASGKKITPAQYISIAKTTYQNNDNFLVKNNNTIPKEKGNYYKPFQPIKVTEIKSYIESSSYWANEMAINALSKTLNLNIIPIENKANMLRIPFGNFLNENNDWTKYLFLYYTNGHYELITFDYKIETNKKVHTKVVDIFDRSIIGINYIAPYFILFIIFGSYYTSISEKDKSQFAFFEALMKENDNTINNDLYKLNIYNHFYSIFKTYFPTSKIRKPASLKGGYNQYYMQHKIDEKPRLAYHITIDMELYPGKTIPQEELQDLKCNSKWNAVRKAYSEFTGKPYEIQPVYRETRKNINQTSKRNVTHRR
jgi:hypothetical protein